VIFATFLTAVLATGFATDFGGFLAAGFGGFFGVGCATFFCAGFAAVVGFETGFVFDGAC